MKRDPLLLLILSACFEVSEGDACIDVDESATSCPLAEDVDLDEVFVPMECDDVEVRSVSGEGDLGDRPSQIADDEVDLVCCYDAEIVDLTPGSDCAVGRPLRGAAIAGATAWERAGRNEHASAAAFAALALELMAHGAPIGLVGDVLAAAQDELRHAASCFARGGAPAPIPVPVLAPRPLAEMAAEAVRDGCLVETLGAIAVRAAAAEAPDPEVRKLLSAIAEDEARHAALSWRVVAWALRTGQVREAVIAALRAMPAMDVRPLAERSGVPAARLREAIAAGVTDVIRPAARAVMAA